MVYVRGFMSDIYTKSCVFQFRFCSPPSHFTLLLNQMFVEVRTRNDRILVCVVGIDNTISLICLTRSSMLSIFAKRTSWSNKNIACRCESNVLCLFFLVQEMLISYCAQLFEILSVPSFPVEKCSFVKQLIQQVNFLTHSMNILYTQSKQT